MPTDYNDWRCREIEEAYDRRDRELAQEEIDPEEWDEFCEDVIIANTGAFAANDDMEYIEFAKGEIADHQTNFRYWR